MVKNIPTTKKLYLKDSYLKRYECSILRFVREKGKKEYIILDTAKIKNSMNFVYSSKTEQKANFIYTILSDIGLGD